MITYDTARQFDWNMDLTEDNFFRMYAKLRRTDNAIIICSTAYYITAKEIATKHPELRLRILQIPSLPGKGRDAWCLVDLNDMYAVYNEGA